MQSLLLAHPHFENNILIINLFDDKSDLLRKIDKKIFKT